VLITGGAGYLGSHMARLLQDTGRQVVVYDNLSTGHRKAVTAPFVQGDLFDTPTLMQAFETYGVTSVIHFAANSLVAGSMANPAKYYHNNVSGTLNLLRCMIDANVKHLVFSSTAAIYGIPVTTPITEDMPKAPISVYGRTKWMIEQMLADFDMAYGLKSVALRYFNAAGAYPSGELGEDHQPETHLIPLVIRTILDGTNVPTISGVDYQTPDGTNIRDYIHVMDLCDAHIKALDALEAGAQSTAYNLGNGTGFSVREMVEIVSQVTGRKLMPIEGPRRPGDPDILVASSARIRDELGWTPQRTDLADIVASAWKWHSAHPNGYAG